ncbi:hypothetical protein CcaverHIS002_0113690 [Cutaneotrichosporon cavernicola]|uniref:Enoyl reductase (ER) domain-containing protein n=1 Tax=Cutaneotrichosporon cavernicola TaxID=279322 RepID=A0AA48II93_9TREE|nr:uncharacterized protein CcaverHIS019_0113560 [Cutaneotrichosporon cavernicola]BEI80840.1 hypothetical protein CcaverHIS002_0113690 [Cutaneotrichosporon cavernicola]BEI88638.1 hypothetical protein CcaverHIS019_0113560 [Cutaneotrichosporon cavernicola]BEI96411.1 hypothetical protein CcaverHIS631_0113600 [Cutaneotrichosporon cavernicola]BEJ04183.1 hypothetical protein CcaverHIS641_0113580 [Cutaneotrichosporon cavernicola]
MSPPADLTNIPKKHKAAIYDKPGTLSIKVTEIDTPEPAQGEVLVRLTHSGVCHSDYGVMMNAWPALPAPTPEGQVGGHEGVGYVAKLGPGLDNSPVKVGDRVGIKWMSAVCNACIPCLSGRDASCTAGKISGYFTPGTFQQYAIAPASYVTPIPEGLDSASAAPQLCAGLTVYAALQKADVSAGQFVVIMGAGGGLGHLACSLAANGLGARVIGIDHGSKKDVANANGVEFFIDFTQTKDVAAKVMEITGGLGAHAVLVLTASNAAYGQSLTFLRFGGTAVCVGVPEGEMVPVASAAPPLFIFKELRLVGSAVGGRLQAIETLDFAARGVIKTHYKTAKLEDLAQVFQDMEDGKIQGRVVLEMH